MLDNTDGTCATNTRGTVSDDPTWEWGIVAVFYTAILVGIGSILLGLSAVGVLGNPAEFFGLQCYLVAVVNLWYQLGVHPMSPFQ